MKFTEYLLSKVAEEAAEVAQMAVKTLQYGLNQRYKDGPTNAERLCDELTDLLSVVALLVATTERDLSVGSFQYPVISKQISRDKLRKVEHYYNVAKQNEDRTNDWVKN